MDILDVLVHRCWSSSIVLFSFTKLNKSVKYSVLKGFGVLPADYCFLRAALFLKHLMILVVDFNIKMLAFA